MKLILICALVSVVSGFDHINTKDFYRIRPQNGKGFRFGTTLALTR